RTKRPRTLSKVATVMSFINKHTRVTSEQQFKAGAATHLKGGLHVRGSKLTQKEIVFVIDERAAVSAAVAVAKATYEQAVALEREKLDGTDALVSAMRAQVQIMFGTSADV